MTDTSVKPFPPEFMRRMTILCIIALTINLFSFGKNVFAFLYPQQQVDFLLQGIKDDQAMTAKLFHNPEAQQQSKEMMAKLTPYFTSLTIQKLAMTALISTFLCAIGIILMWRLRNLGFHFFIIGAIIGFLGEFILFGGSGLSFWSALLNNAFWIIVLILFAKRLKYMQ